MMTSVRRQDRLVEEYLAAVADACAGLPAARRADLISDLREHISVARADLADPTEADIRSILDRLGEPEAIGAEARLGEPQPSLPTASPPASRPVMSTAAVVTIAVLVSFLLAIGAGLALVLPTAVTESPRPIPAQTR